MGILRIQLIFFATPTANTLQFTISTTPIVTKYHFQSNPTYCTLSQCPTNVQIMNRNKVLENCLKGPSVIMPICMRLVVLPRVKRQVMRQGKRALEIVGQQIIVTRIISSMLVQLYKNLNPIFIKEQIMNEPMKKNAIPQMPYPTHTRRCTPQYSSAQNYLPVQYTNRASMYRVGIPSSGGLYMPKSITFVQYCHRVPMQNPELIKMKISTIQNVSSDPNIALTLRVREQAVMVSSPWSNNIPRGLEVLVRLACFPSRLSSCWQMNRQTAKKRTDQSGLQQEQQKRGIPPIIEKMKAMRVIRLGARVRGRQGRKSQAMGDHRQVQLRTGLPVRYWNAFMFMIYWAENSQGWNIVQIIVDYYYIILTFMHPTLAALNLFRLQDLLSLDIHMVRTHSQAIAIHPSLYYSHLHHHSQSLNPPHTFLDCIRQDHLGQFIQYTGNNKTTQCLRQVTACLRRGEQLIVAEPRQEYRSNRILTFMEAQLKTVVNFRHVEVQNERDIKVLLTVMRKKEGKGLLLLDGVEKYVEEEVVRSIYKIVVKGWRVVMTNKLEKVADQRIVT